MARAAYQSGERLGYWGGKTEVCWDDCPSLILLAIEREETLSKDLSSFLPSLNCFCPNNEKATIPLLSFSLLMLLAEKNKRLLSSVWSLHIYFCEIYLRFSFFPLNWQCRKYFGGKSRLLLLLPVCKCCVTTGHRYLYFRYISLNTLLVQTVSWFLPAYCDIFVPKSCVPDFSYFICFFVLFLATESKPQWLLLNKVLLYM